ncbi:MAG: terminase small subunit [Cyanobacteria bacterium SIG32]|nr:terminase small subunit [Cyanobacteria bacterium SIG32]
MKQITQQQKKFVAEYIKCLDGEVSAKKAGYKSKDLKEIANNLLSKDFVINEIKLQLKKQISSLCVNKGYVIQKLLQIAEFSLEEEDVLDKEGFPTGKRKLRDTSAGLKALESLCKYLGFQKEEDDYKEAKIITISNLDDSKI